MFKQFSKSFSKNVLEKMPFNPRHSIPSITLERIAAIIYFAIKIGAYSIFFSQFPDQIPIEKSSVILTLLMISISTFFYCLIHFGNPGYVTHEMVQKKSMAKLTNGEVKHPSSYMPTFTQYEIPHENNEQEKEIAEKFDSNNFSEQLYSRKVSGVNNSTLECEPSYLSSNDSQIQNDKSNVEVEQNLSILEREEFDSKEQEKNENHAKPSIKRKINPELTKSLPLKTFSPSKELSSKAYHNILIMTEKSDKLSKVDESFSKVKLLKSLEKEKNVSKSEEVSVEKRYCTYCHLEQPLRCKHCRHCKKCVLLFDHHCPWMGTCIGEKNRPFFFFFLVSQIGEISFWGIQS